MSGAQRHDELLWQVDEHDRPLGPCRRGDAHRLALRHRAVHILVYDAAGDVFLQKRSLAKDINPGLWDTSAAGHVDYGEDYDGCAMRELREELGITVNEPPERLFKLAACPDTGLEFVQVYRLCHDGPLLLDAAEIETGRWFAPAELDAWSADEGSPITTSLRLIWRTLWNS
jgi:isopentenyldiphosphate isomerase